jgi:hypothetical protein
VIWNDAPLEGANVEVMISSPPELVRDWLPRLTNGMALKTTELFP